MVSSVVDAIERLFGCGFGLMFSGTLKIPISRFAIFFVHVLVFLFAWIGKTLAIVSVPVGVVGGEI